MINSISFPDAGIALLVATISAILYAAFLYYKENKFSNPTYAKITLAFLRGFSVTLIIILLFSPVIKSLKEEIKPPLIVMADDVSYSVKDHLSNEAPFNKNWENLGINLSENYKVQSLQFAGGVSEKELDSLQRKSTDFSQLFRYIDDNFADQNVGAVVLHSDGIFNEGSNPLYMDAFINTPLYIIAQGDTTRYKDIMVNDVFYNKIAYLGDKFTLQVDVKAFNADGKTTKLIVESGGKSSTKTMFEENISIKGKDFFVTKTIELDARAVGLTRYRISVLPQSDEKNKANNYKDIFVEILDGRQKMVLLANSPHPDIAAIKQLVLQNKNYEVTVAYAGENNLNLSLFDMAILHNLPSEKFPVKTELEKLSIKKTPTFFIVGMQTSQPLFNQAQELLTITGNSKNTEEIQTDISNSFTAFTISDQLKNVVKSFPPLLTPFGEYKVKGNGIVFSTQNIKKIKTNYPQLIFGESKGIRTGIFCGEGLWKWRLANYVQSQNYDIVTELLNKSLQWTSLKEDKRKFRVNPGKTSYKENEPILVDAQLYNDNYELVNEPDAALTIRSEEGKEYKYTFSRSGQNYTLNAGMYPAGTYTLSASVSLNNKLLTAQNKFTIESIDLEKQDHVAKHDVLRALVQKYGGKLVYPEDMDSLATIIMEDNTLKPTIYQSNLTKSIIHYKWIGLLILLLLGSEWFLRRYLGSY